MSQRPQITPRFESHLPIVQSLDAIQRLIAAHPVVILAGETGSGKTTQIPKICLALGRGREKRIGCTQPRRIAARALATRLAEELDSSVGQAVGYKVRFSDQVSQASYLKIMTDGILLAETQTDPLLKAYDTLIIDEAHERSLNIDFLLGYLKRILPKRQDLKVIVTSATIDTARFSAHFDQAPVIEVSGRTYPVELRYRPIEELEVEEASEVDGILAAVDELCAESSSGDVLVFVTGEREIRETAEALRKHHPAKTQILPLFARQSASEQQAIFNPTGARRIIISTNVAETSLTVPGIKYVVDTGLARISRYSVRAKVQQLPVEKISQASANQRAGRCGRVSDGICIRLYSAADFSARPEFTEPEILRTQLASVILRMKALKLGDIRAFPFVEPPPNKLITDAVRALQELGALNEKEGMTPIGHQLAKLPLDPAMGRMLLAADQLDVLAEVVILAAVLSIQDPREFPMDWQAQAKEKHARFSDERSDFVAWLNLWVWFEQQRHHLTQSKLRKLCRDDFISYNRMNEWRELVHQLTGQVKELGLDFAPMQQAEWEDERVNRLHKAMLYGLLNRIGLREERKEYRGVRQMQFLIHPTSGLYAAPPQWVMGAELVETSKLYARSLGRIDPVWVEQIARFLCKYQHTEPHWSFKAQQVLAHEQVSLYGLVLIANRKVNFGAIDPPVSRQLFIRHALVLEETKEQRDFLQANAQLIARLEKLEDKARRKDWLVDEDKLFAFYDKHIPADVHNWAKLDQWLKSIKQTAPKLLYMQEQDLLEGLDAGVDWQDYPDQVQLGSQFFAQLDYEFEPGQTKDGLIVKVPLPFAWHFKAERFSWLVPGLLKEKAEWLLKSLPKVLRRQFVPVPERARQALQALSGQQEKGGSFEEAFVEWLNAQRSPSDQAVKLSDFDLNHLPDLYRPLYQLIDEKGRILEQSGDLAQLLQKNEKAIQQAQSHSLDQDIERQDLLDWPDDLRLPESIDLEQYGQSMRVYPALQAGVRTVSVKLFSTQEEAHLAHQDGVLQLLEQVLQAQMNRQMKSLEIAPATCLQYHRLAPCDALKKDCFVGGLKSLLQASSSDLFVRTPAEFAQLKEALRGELFEATQRRLDAVSRILSLYQPLAKKLYGPVNMRLIHALSDMKSQLDALVFAGFAAELTGEQLSDVLRYIKALERRLSRLENDPAKDARAQIEVRPLWEAYLKLTQPKSPQAQQVRWLIEEWRVSVFAPELKTKVPVSAKKIKQLMQGLL